MLFPTSVFQYEQRGWEKFFTVKQRGICLLVINFTLIIYHAPTCIGKLFVWYFTILSKTIHVPLSSFIYMCIRQLITGGKRYGTKNKIRNPPAVNPDQLLHKHPRTHAPCSDLYNIPDPLSFTPALLPLPRNPQPLQRIQINEMRDGPFFRKLPQK